MASLDSIYFTSDSSDSDVGEERLEKRKNGRQTRNEWETNTLNAMDNNDYRSNFRLNKNAFHFLLGELSRKEKEEKTRIQEERKRKEEERKRKEEEMKRKGEDEKDDKTKEAEPDSDTDSEYSLTIPKALKLAITLRYCAKGFLELKYGNNTVPHGICFQMINLLEKHICPEQIMETYSGTEIKDAKSAFKKVCGFDGVIGAIGSTHIKICEPSKNAEKYYRSGSHAVDIMIVCDHKMRIRFINASPGKSRDLTVFAKSKIMAQLKRLKDIYLLGDESFNLQPYLMTPYREAKGSVEEHYNIKHAEGRSFIERTIGIFQSQWRYMQNDKCLPAFLHDTEQVNKIAKVCAALHNIWIAKNITFDEENIKKPNLPEIYYKNEDNKEAEEIREKIAKSVFKAHISQ